MSNDIRSLITSGSRAKVSPRDATLSNNTEKQKKRTADPVLKDTLKGSAVSSSGTKAHGSPHRTPPTNCFTASHEETLADRRSNQELLSTPQNQSGEKPPTVDLDEASSSEQIDKLQTELSQLPENGKRLAVHLEKELRNELVSYCNQEEITPETFVEASLVILKQHQEIKAEIVSEARSRLSLRKRAGFLRRTISMLKGI